MKTLPFILDARLAANQTKAKTAFIEFYKDKANSRIPERVTHYSSIGGS
jgi:hypothetical protein